MKRKLIKNIIIGAVVAAVAVGGYFGYTKIFASKATNATAQYMEIAARNMTMQVNIQGTGAAYAAVSKDILANNNGTLSNLSVNVGDTVKTGQTLFTSDSDDLKQNVEKAQNNLDKEKLTLANAKSDNEIAMDNLAVNDAENQLSNAQLQLNQMNVASPINGLVVAVNNTNGDSIQQGKAVLTVVDPNSMKVKVAVDELDIAKVKLGQTAQITFDAIKDTTFAGTVESIAQTGTSSNNVTTYDVTVSITNPTGVKIGMNANVNILVENKENALAIPSAALIEKNGKKYVMVPTSTTSTSTNNQNQGSQSGQNSSGWNGQGGSGQNGSGQSGSGQSGTRQRRNGMGGAGYSGGYNLVEVTTGIENESYVEILSGITEGQQVLINMPKTSSSSSSSSRSSSGFGNSMGGFGGGFGGGNSGRSQSGSSGKGGN